MALIHRPATPHTPYDLFAALAISPTLATGQLTPVPSISLFPPTPTGIDEAISPSSPAAPPEPKHRPLTNNEARQMTLLLTQYLWPVRGHPKALMRESIQLAEKLHEAGIRWDRHRRVMGTHLRGIWDEGQRLGNVRGIGGHSAMDLYVQGNFLSIQEDPHPLDPMPIAIELNPSAYAALPRLTLHSGLANALPGNMPAFQAHPIDPVLEPQTATTLPVANHFGPKKGRWRDKKKNGLHIRTEGHIRSGTRGIPGQHSAILASARMINGAGVGRWPRFKSTLMLGRVRLAKASAKRKRRVSFGGWEVR